MSEDLFLMTLDKKGKVVIVPYPKKKVWDTMVNGKDKRGLKI